MSIDELVNQTYARFSESDRAVWGYLSVHRDACANMGIETLAKKSCVSRTAVMRFAQKLGFHGFAELKVYLKMDNKKTNVSDQVEQICELYAHVMDNIRGKNCDALFAAMDHARQLYVCGEGMVQTSVKKELKRIFLTAALLFYDVPSGDEMRNLLPMMKSTDLCVLISVSGENERMISMARNLRVRGVTLVSLTKSRENTLAHLCDFHLYVESSQMFETPQHWLYESTTAYFILIDMLFLKYLEYERGKEREHETGEFDSTKL